MKLFIVAILAIFLIGGCNTTSLKIVSKPVDRIPLVLPDVDRIYKRDIKWIVVTPKNAEEIFTQLKKLGKPLAVIGVDGNGYKILALSNGDKIQLIRQLRAQIEAYKKYYIAVEDRDTKHNKKSE